MVVGAGITGFLFWGKTLMINKFSYWNTIVRILANENSCFKIKHN